MYVLIGGAGYIGSVVAEELISQGDEVIVIDDLSTGHQSAIPEEVEFRQANMTDRTVIEEIAEQHNVESVLLFAARACVSESMRRPKEYWNINFKSTTQMINHWIEQGVTKFVFSSTAAVYGEPEYLPIDEHHPKNPVNTYGRTKLAVEWYLEDLGKADGVQTISLRYFNAAGAGDHAGEDHDPETHLIPNLLSAVLESNPFYLYGSDYDTRDGTCLRDFVHVKDLAVAHRNALQKINGVDFEAFNLGSGTGYTVKDVIDMVQEVTGRSVRVVEDDPRPGDPAKLLASNDKAQRELEWSPRRSLRTMVEDAWEWKQNHPDGYPI